MARRQQGVVARWQLLQLGVTPGQIDGWVERDRLRPRFRGVYLVGPVVSSHTDEIAAVLACGPTGVLSHRSATYLYELLPYPARRAPLDVTVTAGRRGRQHGIRLHRTCALLPHEIRERHGVPVTSPTRTLIDFAPGAEDPELERAVAEAFALRLTNRGQLVRALDAAVGRRGVARLRVLLDAGPKLTRSDPERRLLRAIRAAGLPEPLTNHRLGPWEVDLYWPEHALVVEIDGYAAHSSRAAFERDRRKDSELNARGLTVQRLSGSQVREDTDQAVGWIAARLTPEPGPEATHP